MTGGGLAAPLTAEATVNADPAPDLSVIKSMCPTTVTEAGVLTYTFTLQNRGATATTATDNVSLTDTFTPPLTITSVTLNGTALTAPTQYTYDAATGVFATAAGVATVLSDVSATYLSASAMSRSTRISTSETGVRPRNSSVSVDS